MTDKYIDLAGRIKRDRSAGPITGFDGETYALRWLDQNPEACPGRTITMTQLRAGMKAEGIAEGEEFEQFWTGTLGNFGITVVPDPDPEPSNAELIDEAYEVWDRYPQDFTFGEYLVRLGWTKAPGADDEH